ncbi:MAG: transposase [Sphingobacteriales bacterium]|nr:MAG: transposase [Sphingobacteriales bacterium]
MVSFYVRGLPVGAHSYEVVFEVGVSTGGELYYSHRRSGRREKSGQDLWFVEVLEQHSEMPHIRDLFFLCFSDSCGETEIISDGGRASRTDRGGQEADSGTEKEGISWQARSAEGRCLVRGRKQGSKNRPKQPNPTASFRAFTALLNKLLSCLPGINLTYMVADCAYASADYFSAVTKTGLHLITRLPVNAALVYAYSDPVAPKHRGRPKKYGEKVDLNNLDNQELKDTKTENGLLTQIWQLPCYNKSLSKNLLNVGIVKITNLKTQKSSLL